MLNARELVTWDRDRLWSIPDDVCKVSFDDGVLETYGRATIYSVLLWGFYRSYPEMKTRVKHHLGDRRVGSNTHIQILNTLFWDCHDDYQEKGIQLNLEEMMEKTYRIVNDFYNTLTYRLESEVRSIDITDFIEVVSHPVIAKANQEVQPNIASIERTKKDIKAVLTDPKELIGNPISSNAKNGLTSIGQILQCVGPRGSVTEIDSNVFPIPITSGYVHGIRKIEDSLKESRSASKALAFSEVPLQTTEYFNRRLQLMAASVRNLHPVDCGSTEFIDWVIMPTDLDVLAGKYYYSPDGLKVVSKSDRHLIGEKISIRSALRCKHPDPQGVCLVCYGELGLSVPNDSNIGHVAATMLCEQASQNVLSTKHHDEVSNIETLQVSEYDQKYIQLGSDPNMILLADRLEKFRVVITIPSKDAARINDVQYVDDVRKLQLTGISSIANFHISATGVEMEEIAIIPISIGSRMASMSYELLSYIKENGLTTTAQGHYQIDLINWKFEHPLFVLPMRHLNMLEYMNVIASFLRASTSENKSSKKSYKGPTLKDFTDDARALIEFNRIVSSRLRVSLSNLEILIYAAKVKDPFHLDYSLPKSGEEVKFGSFTSLMSRRSLSAAMAFEHHKRILYDPVTYLIDNRLDHPLDKVLL